MRMRRSEVINLSSCATPVIRLAIPNVNVEVAVLNLSNSISNLDFSFEMSMCGAINLIWD
jgi:hypothetical protein